MTRRMRDAAFREQQVAKLRAKHIAPINKLVEELRNPTAGLWAPYVAPMYGGTNARLLSVLRDPGPKTNTAHGGSGFLCMENDDATAERIAGLFSGAGISAGDIVPRPITRAGKRSGTRTRPNDNGGPTISTPRFAAPATSSD